MDINLAACYCTFRRDADSEIEVGLAITTSHYLSDVIAIYPADATTRHDALPDVYEYMLDWTKSLYPPKE